MKIRKEVRIGFVMLLAITLLFWGANYLKGTNFLNKDRHFYSIYDNVAGLTRSNPVLINGFKVGHVEEINFLPDFSGRLLVKFAVSHKDFQIPITTKAAIVSSDILGSKAISLELGDTTLMLANNDTLMSEVEASLTDAVNQQIAPLKKKAESLIGTIDSAINIVSSIFNTKARNDLASGFASIRGSLEAFEKTMLEVDDMVREDRAHLKAIFINVESITDNLAANNKKLNTTLANIESITDSLAGANLQQIVNNASTAMLEVSELIGRVNNGEGSLGALLNNDSLYHNLEAAAYDLDQLLLDMRLNPERYVHFSIFGRKTKKKESIQE